MAETLSPTDLALLTKAHTQLQAAQSNYNFVSTHVTEVYQIGPKDSIDISTGIITRGVA